MKILDYRTLRNLKSISAASHRLCSCALSFMLVSAVSASPNVLFTNFGTGLSYNTGSFYVVDGTNTCFSASPQAVAMQFQPVFTAPFGDALLALGLFSGVNQLSVYLETDAGGKPGQVLEEISVTGLSSGFPGSVINATSFLHPRLVAGTRYWLAVVSLYSSTCAGWFLDSTGDNSNGTNAAYNFVSSPTGPWTNSLPGSARAAFEIDAAEPATTLTPAPGSPDLVGNNPEAIVVADFNDDGKQDFAVANIGGGNVTLRLGNGDGTFSGPYNYAAGTAPRAIAAADLNGDGFPDIVVVNSSTGISVLLNNGSGGFSRSATYTAGSTPEGIAIADFNGDKCPDIAVTNAGSNSVSIFLNVIESGKCSATFRAAALLPVGQGPSSIAVGDFNGDGNLDLAVLNSFSLTVSVLFGTGTNSLFNGGTTSTLEPALRTLDEAQLIAVGDFNSDKLPDLAIATYEGAIVLINNRLDPGSFLPGVAYPADDFPSSIAVGDFNGDGILDLVLANAFSSDMSVLIGNGSGGVGNGTFKAAVNFPLGFLPDAIAVGIFDIKGNTKEDVAVANYGEDDVSVLLGM